MCPVSRCRHGLRRDLSGSALPKFPQSVSRGARLSRLHWFAFLLRPVRLLAPLDGSDRVSPATGGFYIQASDGSVTLPVAGYDYNSTGLLCWRDFHPQEWQLASLHQILDDTARLLPDLVCFGGDYINGMLFGRGRVPPEVIASKLARLKPPLGTFAVLGDHDRLFGAERITRSLHETGVDVLVNDTRSLLFEGWTIYLVGVSPDANALQSLLDHLPPGSATVILAHDPAAFARMPKGPHLM